MCIMIQFHLFYWMDSFLCKKNYQHCNFINFFRWMLHSLSNVWEKITDWFIIIIFNEMYENRYRINSNTFSLRINSININLLMRVRDIFVLFDKNLSKIEQKPGLKCSSELNLIVSFTSSALNINWNANSIESKERLDKKQHFQHYFYSTVLHLKSPNCFTLRLQRYIQWRLEWLHLVFLRLP